MNVFEVAPIRPSLRLPLLLLPLLLAAPVQAQPPTFEGSSDVVAVEVPVNVVDRNGEPVRGLTADDFEVYDGGERQKITSFEVIDLRKLDVEPTGAEAARLANLPSAARRHFLLLFDLSFSTPTSILKARMAARDFLLNGLHPSDLAGVATYSLETGPRLVVTFTPDRAQLARAIDTLGYRRSAENRGATDHLRFMIEAPTSMGQTTSPGIGLTDEGLRSGQQGAEQALFEYLQTIAFGAERSERAFEMSRISAYSRALGEMARALNSVKGRKHVVFFSEGFDSRLLLGRETTDIASEDDNLLALRGQTYFVDNDNRYGNTSLQGDINRMLDEFRRSDSVIQAVDIGGLRAGADERARPSGQEALFYLANETGGELFKDANNLREPLERVIDRTSVTYLLSFERSDLKPDGAYHRLKVKPGDKFPAGARLSHRTGYYAPRPFKSLGPLEKSLLASDGIAAAAPRRDIELHVLAAPFRSTEKVSYVPLIIEAGGGGLLDGHKDKVLRSEIYGYGSDSEGRMRDYFSQRVELNLGDKGRREMAEGGGLKYYGHFDLEPGAYQVRVLVRNADTGRTGVHSVAVTVPTYDRAQPVLLPPFFMEDRQKWVLVREQDGGGQLQGSVFYPFTVSGEPYVPAARPILRGEKLARLCLVAYNLGKGDLSVAGTVTASDGQSSPAARLSQVERTATGIPGLDKLTATFDAKGLQAGRYTLQVAVTDPATGNKQMNSLSFDVVH
ncbi:MAG TPA: VWA domain-containing protein [Thermoanaerobaculia bacterium]|nr:VWA domain-containing protein [Thermoanaerobaculia bacterium]